MPTPGPVTGTPANAEPEEKELRPGVALCLSGGGYRAMVFHLGVLWRLYEAGRLKGLARISSVSGGSITSATLGIHWDQLSFDPSRMSSDFVPHVVGPIRALAGKTIDVKSVLLGLMLPGSISDRVKAAYDKHLFGGKTLQALPDSPRFVINATNVQTGVLMRFSKPYLRDYRVGELKNPSIPLSVAVAASSAFPPVLSPLRLDLDSRAFTPNSGLDLQQDPYTSRVVLTDGGVYDNLGLETAWKSHRTILVSDAGAKIQPQGKPGEDWARHAYRVLDLVDNQVRSLRKRQLIDSYEAGLRTGAYWGIRTDIADYGLADPLPCPVDRTMELARTPTRLKALDDNRQERLINWGYAVCDAALRRHVDPAIPKGSFPYPDTGV